MDTSSEINSQDYHYHNENIINLRKYYYHWFFQLILIMTLKLSILLNKNLYNYIIEVNIGLFIKIFLIIIWVPWIKNSWNIWFDRLIYILVSLLMSLIFNYYFLFDKNNYINYFFYLIFINSVVLCLKLNFFFNIVNKKQFIIVILLCNWFVFYISLIFYEIEFFYRFLITGFTIFFIFYTNIEIIDINLSKENYILNSLKLWFLSLFSIFKLAEKIASIFISFVFFK